MPENDGKKELKGKIYKCENCGSILVFDPESQKLKCGHCASLFDLQSIKKAMELTYTSFSEKEYEPWGEAKSYKCRSCGAVVDFLEYETASKCSFCGASNIAMIDDIPGLKPNAILPFAVPRNKLEEYYAKWMKSKKMAPSKLKDLSRKMDTSGVYVPIFTFDTSTSSSYSIKYGITRSKTVGSGKNRRVVTYTEWYYDTGFINLDFDDIQIEASQKISQKDLSKLGYFDTENSLEYNSQYISGFNSERYSKSLDDSWDDAKKEADGTIRQRILSRYHYDTLGYLNVSTNYSNIKYKYVLVPVWIIHYKYKKKIYPCILNGRTGKGVGKAPVSPFKATGLGLAIAAVCAFIIYMVYKYFIG